MLAFGEILDQDLAYLDVDPSALVSVGRLSCRHNLFVDVRKRLAIEGGFVRTVWYSYHAGIIGTRDRSIFQYDNAHAYTREGHPDAHHRHRFDHVTWTEIEPPEWVGHDRWPHLDEVVRELMNWWETTGRHLGLSESSP